MDVYGSGEDMDAIKTAASEAELAITFFPGRDHLDDKIHSYRSHLPCILTAGDTCIKLANGPL